MEFEGAASNWITTGCSAGNCSPNSSGPRRWPVRTKAVKSLHTVFAREGAGRRTGSLPGHPPPRGPIVCHADHHRPADRTPSWPPLGHPCTRPRTARKTKTANRFRRCSDPSIEVELDLIPWETRSADDLGAATTGPPRVRGVDAHPGRRPRAGAGARRLRDRPDPDRNRAAADGRGQPARQRHAVHLGRHLAHHVVSPTVPHRRWLLLRQHSPVLAHGRCFGRGDVLTEDGALVASYAKRRCCAFATTANRPAHDAKVFAYRTKQAIWRSSFSLWKNISSENGSHVDTRAA